MVNEALVRPQYEIKKGDRVRITAQGAVRVGLVSTSHWSRNGGYNIELVDDNVGYTYWKQGSDGGTVMLLEVGPELPTMAGTLRTMRDHSATISEMQNQFMREVEGGVWRMNQSFHDEMGTCMSWDVTAPAWPTVTVYHYTFWNDDRTDESDLTLVGDEAMQMMDWVYGGPSGQERE